MKTTKIIRNGRTQVIKVPKEFHFDDSEVYIKKCGNVVQLIPRRDPWDPLFSSLNKFSADFRSEHVQPVVDELEKF